MAGKKMLVQVHRETCFGALFLYPYSLLISSRGIWTRHDLDSSLSQVILC